MQIGDVANIRTSEDLADGHLHWGRISANGCRISCPFLYRLFLDQWVIVSITITIIDEIVDGIRNVIEFELNPIFGLKFIQLHPTLLKGLESREETPVYHHLNAI